MKKRSTKPQLIDMPIQEKESTPVPSRTNPTCVLSWKTFGKCSTCGMQLNSPGSPLRALHKNEAGEFCSLCCVKCRGDDNIEWGF